VRQASGLAVLVLPFAEDIRKVNVPEQPKASAEQIRAAKALVKALNIDFDSRNFPNPSLQQHYANLYALATDRAPDAIVNDTLVFDEEGAARHASFIAGFREAVGLSDDYMPDPKTTPGKKKSTPKKRTRGDEDDEDTARPTKRARTSSVGAVDAATYDWAALVRDDALDTLKVPELRAYCAQHGLKNVSRLGKGDLIETIKKHVQQQAAKS
jgi:ATP-dependent DNA helicase 2 subunit 1